MSRDRAVGSTGIDYHERGNRTRPAYLGPASRMSRSRDPEIFEKNSMISFCGSGNLA